MSIEVSILFVLLTILLSVLYYFKYKDLVGAKIRAKHLEEFTQSLNITINSLKDYNTQLTSSLASLQGHNDQLVSSVASLQKTNDQFVEYTRGLQERIDSSYSIIPELVNQQVAQFKENEMEQLRATLSLSAKQTAMAELEAWKIKHEAFYRQDAINRSQAVIMGKVTEHLIPFHSSFPFNPKEARFIGSPIDIIVFDGIDNEDVVDIYILEIKTSGSSLSKRQKLIKSAVLEGRVHWRELRM